MDTDTDPRHAGPEQPHLVRTWLLVAITVILTGWALKAAGAFLVPVVFSFFLALLVAPVDRWVRAKVPRGFGWLGHAAAMGAILAAVLIFVSLIWFAAQQLVTRFPMPTEAGNLLPQFGSEVHGGQGAAQGATQGAAEAGGSASPGGGSASPGGGSASQGGASPGGESGPAALFAQAREMLSGAGGSFAARLAGWASGIATSILNAAGAVVGAVTLVLFLTFIMLIEGSEWQQKIVSALGPSAREKTLDSVGTIADRLRRYLLARTLLGLVTAALYALWLWIFGVDLLIVWALLAFLMNYIPTLGSLIAGILPVFYAFMQKDPGTAMLVGGGILVIEQVMGNYVDPRVQGNQVSLSSLVVLVTLLVWGWIWGIAGAVLAVPITICVMIICAHVRPLRPFALMLSNATDMDGLNRQSGVEDASV